MTPTWLVTGSSGFLGANAGLWLEGKAHRIGIARGPAPTCAFDQQFSIDLCDAAAVHEVVSAIRPDVILNAAAMASHEECERHPDLAAHVNVDAARVVADAAASVGSTLVQISTDAVFDGLRGGYTEADEPSPFSVYGNTKLRGELAVLDSAADALVVRTNFFGWSPLATRSILEFFVTAMRDGRAVHGYTDFVVTSLYVRSLMEMIDRLAASPHRGLVHVTSTDALSKFDFSQLVAAEFGLPGDVVTPVAAESGGHATSRARNLSLSTVRLAGWLGSVPPTQLDGIRTAYADEPSITTDFRDEEVHP